MSAGVVAIDWALIQPRLAALEAVEGGYSGATRGLLALEDGSRVFVKIGVDERTRAWARKEVGVYGRLRELGFPFAPRLLSSAPDATGFALDALTQQHGWDWSNCWSTARLECVLAATDHLASIDPGRFEPSLTEPTLTARADGWPALSPQAPRTQALYSKLEVSGARHLIAALETQGGRPSSFSPRFDTLIHLDLRSDNCAWRADTREVGLVDWTWLQVGDRRVDHAALLTSVRHSGFDVTRGFPDRLDGEALTWMAGYWFAASMKPLWRGGPSGLRDHQFSMAVAALELAAESR